MTDRDLLEAAARAAGMTLIHAPDSGPFRGCQFLDGKSAAWNPLEDDGDALRLAVKLHMDIFTRFEWSEAVAPMGPAIKVARKDDPYAATRRAIVRAAAAIGGRG